MRLAPRPARSWLDKTLGAATSFYWGVIPDVVREPNNAAGDEFCVAANASEPLQGVGWGWADASCVISMPAICRLMGELACSAAC